MRKLLSVVVPIFMCATIAGCSWSPFETSAQRARDFADEGLAAFKSGKYEKAEKCYLSAQSEAGKSDDPLQLPRILSETADVYIAEKKLTEAENCLQSALDKYVEVSHKEWDVTTRESLQDRLVIATLQLANIKRARAEWPDAEKLYKSALAESAKMVGELNHQPEIQKEYSVLLQKMGRHDDARNLSLERSASLTLPSDFDFQLGKLTDQVLACKITDEHDPQIETLLAASKMYKDRKRYGDLQLLLSLIRLGSGDVTGAESAAEEALKYPIGTFNTIRSSLVLYISQSAQGKKAEAENALSRAADIMIRGVKKQGGVGDKRFNGLNVVSLATYKYLLLYRQFLLTRKQYHLSSLVSQKLISLEPIMIWQSEKEKEFYPALNRQCLAQSLKGEGKKDEIAKYGQPARPATEAPLAEPELDPGVKKLTDSVLRYKLTDEHDPQMDALIALVQADPDKTKYAEVLQLISVIRMGQGDMKGAESAAQDATQKGSKRTRVRALIVVYICKAGEDKSAEAKQALANAAKVTLEETKALGGSIDKFNGLNMVAAPSFRSMYLYRQYLLGRRQYHLSELISKKFISIEPTMLWRSDKEAQYYKSRTRYSLAMALKLQGKLEESGSYAREALTMGFSSDPKLMAQRCVLTGLLAELAIKQNNPQQAERLYKELMDLSVDADPKFWRAFQAQALAYARLMDRENRKDEAEELRSKWKAGP